MTPLNSKHKYDGDNYPQKKASQIIKQVKLNWLDWKFDVFHDSESSCCNNSIYFKSLKVL